MGYELHWVREDAPYIGKVLHINAGARLSLQVHDAKQESWFIMNGHAAVMWENKHGELIETELQPGVGYSTKAGQKHRLKGITGADILEVSTPEQGTTWRWTMIMPAARNARADARSVGKYKCKVLGGWASQRTPTTSPSFSP